MVWRILAVFLTNWSSLEVEPCSQLLCTTLLFCDWWARSRGVMTSPAAARRRAQRAWVELRHRPVLPWTELCVRSTFRSVNATYAEPSAPRSRKRWEQGYLSLSGVSHACEPLQKAFRCLWDMCKSCNTFGPSLYYTSIWALEISFLNEDFQFLS